MNLKKLEHIEKLIIEEGRALSNKAVMFKDDVANMKNMTQALTQIEIIIVRLNNAN